MKTICQQLTTAGNKGIKSGGFQHASDIQYHNLVFQGGGAKGLMYVGALTALEEQNLLKKIRRVAGTSAGAITALLVALNFSSTQIQQALQDLTVHKLLGEGAAQFERVKKAQHALLAWLNTVQKRFSTPKHSSATTVQHVFQTGRESIAQGPHILEVLKLLSTLSHDTALSDGSALEAWLKDTVKAKLTEDFAREGKVGEDYTQALHHLTFRKFRSLINEKQFGYKHLHVYVTNLTTSQPMALDSEAHHSRWDEVNVIEAVCASAALPFAFSPRALTYRREKDTDTFETHRFIDGGLLRNRPIEHFDAMHYQDPHIDTFFRQYTRTNQRTLGLFLKTPSAESALSFEGNLAAFQKDLAHDSLGLGTLLWRIGNFFYDAESRLQALRGDMDDRVIALPTFIPGPKGPVHRVETTDFEVVEDPERVATYLGQSKTFTLQALDKKRGRLHETSLSEPQVRNPYAPFFLSPPPIPSKNPEAPVQRNPAKPHL